MYDGLNPLCCMMTIAWSIPCYWDFLRQGEKSLKLITHFCPKILYISDGILQTWTSFSAERWGSRVVSGTCQIYSHCSSSKTKKHQNNGALSFKCIWNIAYQKTFKFAETLTEKIWAMTALCISVTFDSDASLIALLTFRKPELLHKHGKRECSSLT